MRKIFAALFKFNSRLLAVIFAALAVIAIIITILLLSAQRSFLNPETYKNAFVENKIYERLPASAGEQLAFARRMLTNTCAESPLACDIQNASPELQACLTNEMGGSVVREIASASRLPDETESEAARSCLNQYGNSSEASSSASLGVEGTAFLNNLTQEQWNALIVHVLPADELQTMTESTLDGVTAYFKGATDSVQMPLAKLKARFTGKAGEELTLILLEAQPPCTEDQRAQINTGDFGEEGAAPIFCSATGETKTQLSAELQRRLKTVAGELPDDAILIKPPSPSIPPRFRKYFGEDRQSALEKMNAGIPYIPLLPAGLLLMVAVFGVRSLRCWLRWWGIPILVGGLLTLGVCIAAFVAFDRIWSRYVSPYTPVPVASIFGELNHDVANSLANDLAKRMLPEAGLVTVLGLGLVYISRFVKPPPDPSLPPLAPAGQPGGPVLHTPISKRQKKGW